MNALYMKRATDMQFRDPRELTPASYTIKVSKHILLILNRLDHEFRPSS